MQATTNITILNTLAVLGVILVIPHAYCMFDFIWLYFLHPSSVKQYLHGKAPYAIVTGATDEIGKATAAELLTQGFNVILHGQNKSKMQKVVEELRVSARMQRGSANIWYFIADMSKGSHNWGKLLELFGDLHVTVVMHNVGGGTLVSTRIDKHTEDNLLASAYLNTLFSLFLTHALLPQLRHVTQFGPVQVLLIGLFASDTPPLCLSMYGASKNFLKALMWGLYNNELFFGTPTGMHFTYLTMGAVHSDNSPVPIPPSLMVPTSARFAWSLVESIGCGRG